MGRKAFNVLGLIQNGSLFATEYKNHSYAVAEVIDNALDAGADKVYLYLRTQKIDDEIIFELYAINNGRHIEFDKVDAVLTYGFSEAYKEQRTGKFGVGFKQALFSMCKRIDIYSIPDISENEAYTSYFDTIEMLEKNTDEIPSTVSVKISDEFSNTKLIKIFEGLKEDGWKECVVVKASKFLFKKINPKNFREELENNLGRIFRYNLTKSNLFCNNGNITKLDIVIITDNGEKIPVRPQDVLFLMPDDKYLLDARDNETLTNSTIYGVPLFEEFYTDNSKLLNEGYWQVDSNTKQKYFVIDYIYKLNDEIINSNIFFKASLVKSEFVNRKTNRGATDLGRIAQERDSISFVRLGREIDFGTYGLYNNKTQRVQDRFWNIEILYDDKLDSQLGLTNNKQKVLLSKENVDINGISILERIKTVFNIFASELRTQYNLYVRGIKTQKSSLFSEEKDLDKVEETVKIVNQINKEQLIKCKNNPISETPLETQKDSLTFQSHQVLQEKVQQPVQTPKNEITDLYNMPVDELIHLINSVNKDFECENIYYRTQFRKDDGLIFCKARMFKYPMMFQLRVIDPKTFNIKYGIEIKNEDLTYLMDSIKKYLEM